MKSEKNKKNSLARITHTSEISFIDEKALNYLGQRQGEQLKPLAQRA